MKRIEAIIMPFKQDEIIDALTGIGVSGVTIVEVKGVGQTWGHEELYRGSEYVVKILPYQMLIVYATDEMTPLIVETIRSAATVQGTYKIRGIIVVSDIQQVIKIRTGEENYL